MPWPELDLDWPTHRPVLVACSGGSDSLALLDLLRSRCWPIQVAHLDHRGRPDSAQVAAQLETLCTDWGLPFHRRRFHVDGWARRYGLSWEAAGRQVRYSWLRALARKLGALVVTGHTADDQAETVIMRLLQGCTLGGLSAIQSRSSNVARPLLGCRRDQLRDYLRERGLSWFEDPGNQDPRFVRSQVRHRIMPILEELNPQIVGHLHQVAQDALELRQMLHRPVPLVEMGRLQFEEFIHQRWLQLSPPLGARWSRCHAQRIFEALSKPEWRCWNLPAQFWAEWDGHRLSLGRPLSLPPLAPAGLQWRYRRGGERWQQRSLKKVFVEWKLPRRLRDQLPLLVRPPHEVLGVWGLASLEPDHSWIEQERSGWIVVEAGAQDESATVRRHSL